MVLMVDGAQVETDAAGYLVSLTDWTPRVARAMAQADGCQLTEAHWEVIEFLRRYYDEYQSAPPVRLLTKAIGRKLGKEKGNSRYLYELFPDGPAKQACRYAGLPKPVGCI